MCDYCTQKTARIGPVYIYTINDRQINCKYVTATKSFMCAINLQGIKYGSQVLCYNCMIANTFY